jgi:hypothetical protein
MHFDLTHDGHGRLTCRLRDGAQEATVSAAHAPFAAAALSAAFDQARDAEYGECFWQEPTGAYWWILRREESRLEVVVMWSRGGAGGWQHVFRAADEVSWFGEHLQSELGKLHSPGRT